MDKVNVLIVSGADLNRAYLENVAAVDPRISLKMGVKQFIEELRRKGGKDLLVDRLEEASSLWRDWQGNEGQDLDTLLAQAEVIFGRVVLPDNLLLRAPRLKWIHIQGAGLDAYMSTGIFDSNIMLTSGKGTMAVPMAEHALAFIFMLAKNAPRILGSKQRKRWERFMTLDIQQKVAGIIGLGTIGSEVARLARGVGMRVFAMDRFVTKREKSAFGVDEVFPPGELHQMLSQSDFVVISAALTAETTGMISEAELRVMKPTAYLINVARGKIVDQPALVRALKEGWIAGAGLDVFEAEPLPPDSELWELPNVILSYHMSGFTNSTRERDMELFCENLRRYLAGEQLLNIIDRNT